MTATPENASAGKDIPGVIAPPPLIFLGGLGIGFLLEALLPGGSLPGHIHHVLGALFLVLGLGLLGWWVSSFRRADTPLPPYEETTALVTDGPYRLSRNPAYLAFTLIYVAIALLADAPWVLAAFAVGVGGDRPRGDRARGALPGAALRPGLPELQSQNQTLAMRGGPK